ncbi:vanadium-dependent haloperoxidase [Algoriphagus sp.]|uniref:vanadium-dependent haloperoxidase n=1 Tax=Algoriphagus sp. TaxID=1872435 RepID=UPI00261F8631|nr:vanadium-dependent haloperoxidase [Algoriphagus sp.]
MKKILTYQFFLLGSILLLISCDPTTGPEQVTTPNASVYNSDVIYDWGELILTLSRDTPGFSPPVVARAMGYIGIGLYESILPGMPEYKTLQGQLNAFPVGTLPKANLGEQYNWDLVANSAMARIVENVFPNASSENKAAISQMEADWIAKYVTENPTVAERSIAYGSLVGDAMANFADSDTYHEAYAHNFPTSYTPPTTPGSWEPTLPDFSPALQPYWKDARIWLIENKEGTMPGPPPPFSTEIGSQFFEEANEVYHVVQNLTPAQKSIADFWSDDPQRTSTPGGHSFSIALGVLKKEQANLEMSAVTIAKLGIAINDAFISCWNAKYTYNLIRPITYIHRYIDDTWTIPLDTPPFPEYSSGHSVQSGASAQVLTDIFGENYAFTDSMHVSRGDIDGKPRSFNSFFEFADEAAMSRLYGGIHFRSGIEVGLIQGMEVGKNVGKIKFK